MSSMFGDFADEIPDAIKPQTNFWFKLVDVKRSYGVSQEDPKRNSVTLSWEIVSDGNEENEAFVGMRPATTWIPYWDNLTKPEYDAFDEKSRMAWKMGRDNLKAIQRALGYTEAELEEFVPSMLDAKLNEVIVGKVYRNVKSGQDVFDMKSLVPLNLVES